jgi:hypothetical protein
MAAIRVCPSWSRCSVAMRAPARCGADTAAMSGDSAVRGSTTTNRYPVPRRPAGTAPGSGRRIRTAPSVISGDCSGTENYLNPKYCSVYAKYYAKFVSAYSGTYGIPIYMAGMQNEPENCSRAMRP